MCPPPTEDGMGYYIMGVYYLWETFQVSIHAQWTRILCYHRCSRVLAVCPMLKSSIVILLVIVFSVKLCSSMYGLAWLIIYIGVESAKTEVTMANLGFESFDRIINYIFSIFAKICHLLLSALLNCSCWMHTAVTATCHWLCHWFEHIYFYN